MPLDPARVELVKAWFHKAASDLSAGSWVAAGPASGASQAAFHAQQAAEKAMKGFWAWHGVPFPKPPDLDVIGELCVRVDASLREVCKAAESTTKFATVFRYPPSRDATPLEAVGVLRIARAVYDVMLTRLPPEVRPDTFS